MRVETSLGFTLSASSRRAGDGRFTESGRWPVISVFNSTREKNVMGTRTADPASRLIANSHPQLGGSDFFNPLPLDLSRVSRDLIDYILLSLTPYGRSYCDRFQFSILIASLTCSLFLPTLCLKLWFIELRSSKLVFPYFSTRMIFTISS